MNQQTDGEREREREGLRAEALDGLGRTVSGSMRYIKMGEI